MTDWIDKVILSICEMCRDSPDHMPEAMLVTPEELRDLIQTHMPKSVAPESLTVQPAEPVKMWQVAWKDGFTEDATLCADRIATESMAENLLLREYNYARVESSIDGGKTWDMETVG